jgi:hypothetical protein
MSVCEMCKERYPEIYDACDPYDDTCRIITLADLILGEE